MTIWGIVKIGLSVIGWALLILAAGFGIFMFIAMCAKAHANYKDMIRRWDKW